MGNSAVVIIGKLQEKYFPVRRGKLQITFNDLLQEIQWFTSLHSPPHPTSFPTKKPQKAYKQKHLKMEIKEEKRFYA